MKQIQTILICAFVVLATNTMSAQYGNGGYNNGYNNGYGSNYGNNRRRQPTCLG